MKSRRYLTIIKKYLAPIFNTRAAGIYLILFAASIAIATFVENDFGTSAAQKVIFKSWWFELLLLLFGITIIVNIFKFRMIPQKKWPLLLFHGAIIVILIGAGVTRYLGFEGVMHIRENGVSNNFFSSNTFLKFDIGKDGQNYNFDEPVLFASLGNNNWHESYMIGNDLVEVVVKEFIPNPKQILGQSLDGKPTLQLVMAGANGREEYFIEAGQTKRIKGLMFNFKDTQMPDAINIAYKNDSVWFASDKTFFRTVMATQKKDTLYPSTNYGPLLLRSLYSDGVNNVVFSNFNKNGTVRLESEDPKVKNESLTALLMEVSVNGNTKETLVYGSRGMTGRPGVLNFDGLDVSVSYGSKEVTVPFSIKLNKFILDKYPGTNSASSYASEVTLVDEGNNMNMNYRIFMNNILDYKGYRFFQSSFDKDEKGTYLSVNHDFWGTWISYFGYALLTIGMIWTFFNKNTRFYQLSQKIRKLRAKSGTFVLLLFMATTAMAQETKGDAYINFAVAQEHANQFSQLVVQDFKGRMKPMHTLSREIMRKLARKESMYGLTADQIILSLFINKQEWYAVPLIKLGKHEAIKTKLSVGGDYASYKDFFDSNGEYKLREEMRRIYGLEPIDQGVYEKELLKIDERVNILSMAFSGTLLKIVPNPSDPNNTWVSNTAHNHGANDGHNHEESAADTFFSTYRASLLEASNTKDYQAADHLLEELKAYQIQNGGEIMPSEAKIHAEILLNKLNVFTTLAICYIFLGLALLFFLFLSVFKPNINLKKVYLVLFALVVIGFTFHTIGLGLRWFVSGRAPWSNGYESMIYIAWTSTLAGVLFTRKSFGGLAATMVLAATILFVSTLSFLDPEITPLVPVLKSYWLTIHVSLEAGSYGFLMLGAIIGLINLILMVFLKESNKDRIKRIVQEMSYISELTLIGGLFMVSVGTYLGGVWANESWGRYWGWDAKETWALVTILVYAFILHMRLIPKLTGLFAYNLATIFGLATVIMTYYGVNYYLSGLHSYATGDPVPIPNWVYVVVVSIIIISTAAYFRKRKFPGIS